MNDILTYSQKPMNTMIVTFHNNIIKIFNEDNNKNIIIKITDEQGVFSLDLYRDNKTTNISKGGKTEMDNLIKKIAKDLTKKKNNSTLFIACGVLFFFLFSIHCIYKPSYHKNNLSNKDYQNTVSSIINHEPGLINQFPPQVMDTLKKTKDIKDTNIESTKSPVKASISNNDLSELVFIQNMIKNNEPWDKILNEVNKVQNPELARKIKERLEQIINMEKDKNLEQSQVDNSPTSYSVEDINGSSNLVSGKVHIPIPGGGVSDFGLK